MGEVIDEKYYYKSIIKKVFKIISFLLLLLLSILLLILSFRLGPEEVFLKMPGVILVMFFIFTYYVANKLKNPLVIIREDSIGIQTVDWKNKKRNIKREKLDGFVVEVQNNSGMPYTALRHKVIKLIIKEKYKKNYKHPLIIRIKPIERQEHLINKLGELIPDLTAQKRQECLDISKLLKRIKYKKYLVSQKGILIKGLTLIPWKDVTEIKTLYFSIAGYSGIKVKYLNSINKVKSFKLSPKSSDEFINFTKYIINSSDKSEVDPFVYTMFKMSPKQAKAEERLTLINIITFILLWTIYSNEIIERYIFNDLYFLFLLPIFFWAIFMLISQYKQIYIRESGDYNRLLSLYKKIKLSSISIVISFVLFFILSAGSFSFLQGDVYMAMNRQEEALHSYQKVLQVHPKHIEVLYTNAKTLHSLGEYEKSYQLMVKAYDIFDGKWNPSALKLIPESLVQLDRHDEAIKWCEKIIKDKDNEKITEVLGSFKEEIRDMI